MPGCYAHYGASERATSLIGHRGGDAGGGGLGHGGGGMSGGGLKGVG